TVVPTVTSNSASLGANGTTLTINGFGFDPTAANNTIVFNNGAVGTVSAATPTALTVTIGTPPNAVGSLTAVVTSNGQSSGAPIQVATVIPVVTSTVTNLDVHTTSITISGYGFDAIAANNSVVLSDGAVGNVSSASTTSLTVT